MSGQRTLPCFIVFESELPAIAYFDEYAAENEVARRKGEKKLDESGFTPSGLFIDIRVREIPLVDRRKGNRS